VLRLAASLDQVSAHPVAAALVAGAERRGLELELPTESAEGFGRGVEGAVAGRRVVVGSRDWLREHGIEPAPPHLRGRDGEATILVGVDGRLAGEVAVEDQLRDDAHALVSRLRDAGVAHVALVTGDHAGAAGRVGDLLGVDRVYADQSPEEKVEVVRALRGQPGLGGVVMVGDGINDAPALALADVGIALGTLGATVSSETADAVILVDRVDRVADAIRIGRRSLHIARQSVLGGMAASVVAMGVAAAGYLPPVEGALLQEAIDVAVILNALRALRD
jgi:P-type E1-E2 ATPase